MAESADPAPRVVRRRPGNPGWVKGVSGNPGGRPRAIHRVQDLAREYTEVSILALVHIVERGKSESARVAAASALLDRGWGRAPLTVTGPDGERLLPSPGDLVRLSDIQLARVIAVVTEVLDDGAEGGEPRALPP
jgi:hypothetical protein